MTSAELVDLRGEIFGLKILLMSCLTQIAATAPDPVAGLDWMKKEALVGIARASPSNVQTKHLRAFQNAAAGIVTQAVEAAKVPHVPTPPREKLQ